ncbi:MAG: iron-containing alcohol dehydrogenase [Terracidiphilus sp.]|nr:iron-containing alcohol dehydrogenase [Terracidiphilus sp.]
MNTVTLLQVPRLVVGSGCRAQCGEFLAARGVERALLVAPPFGTALAEPLLKGIAHVQVESSIEAEPSVSGFNAILARTQSFKPDAVIGLGGGSALDVAKLVAALLDGAQKVNEVFGIGQVKGRKPLLVCLPTTAGTGSEVSPNAILLDETDNIKKGVVSPFLVPDAAFVDAELTLSVPPAVTAATGLDALTHCIEAYTNKFAHPVVDVWALEGIRRIAESLVEAVEQPSSLAAREKMALGSLYGGLCLGPVNTAAVHALSYPLGGWFHIPHGHANAILLPHVMRFNAVAAPERYSAVAIALGAAQQNSAAATAEAGVTQLWKLIEATKLEMRLTALGIDESETVRLAAAGLSVTRLMNNNPRAMTQQDAEEIFHAAFRGK